MGVINLAVSYQYTSHDSHISSWVCSIFSLHTDVRPTYISKHVYGTFSLRNIPDWPWSVRLSNITRCWLDTTGSQSGWDICWNECMVFRIVEALKLIAIGDMYVLHSSKWQCCVCQRTCPAEFELRPDVSDRRIDLISVCSLYWKLSLTTSVYCDQLLLMFSPFLTVVELYLTEHFDWPPTWTTFNNHWCLIEHFNWPHTRITH